MNEKVARLRQLMSEATPKAQQPTSAQRAAQREYELFAANEPVHPTLDTSPRALALREIMRISGWYQAHAALVEYMDRHCAGSLTDMPEEQLAGLLEHMRQIELCTQTGMGSPYAPPAT